jgi:hypothetical protein
MRSRLEERALRKPSQVRGRITEDSGRFVFFARSYVAHKHRMIAMEGSEWAP